MGTAAAVHPTDQTLHSYGLGKLDDVSSESVSKHLEFCPDCQRRVAEMSSDSFLGRLQKARGSPREVSSTGRSPADSIEPPSAETMPPGLSDHPDYEVIRELGRGGMGVVYLAHNRLLGRQEVLKVMSRHIMERPGVLARFLAEMRAVARLQHPNIVTAYSAFRLGESIVFAMEYVEGLDLAKMVKTKGPLPVARACYFVNQAAQGMQHAHEQGMVHRDIKPGNLMLSHKGNRPLVKVLDFGLAKATREVPVDGGLTNPGQALGTPDYMAPEQIRDAQKADIRADIYSLGCTLYYLLSGGPPFQAENLWDLYLAHHSMDAKLLNFVRPEVPGELASLVAKLMAKEPGRRFQTPAEVAQALTPFFKKSNASVRVSNTELSRAGQPDERPTSPARGSVPTQPATNLAPAPAPPLKKPTEKARHEPQWESLIEFKETEPSRKPAPAPAAPRRPKPPWIWPTAAAGLLLLGLFVAWGVVLWVKTANGMIELVNLPKDAEVFVDGEKVKITWPVGGKPAVITVTAGMHKLMVKNHKVLVKKDGLEISGDEVTVQAEGQEKFTVRVVPFTKPPNPLPKDGGSGSTHMATKGPSPNSGSAPNPPSSQESFKNSIGMTLKLIPAGEFFMGSPDSDPNAGSDEKPQHSVHISKPFYLGVYEVTQAEYEVVMGNNPSSFSANGGDKDKVAGRSTTLHPVESVSWFDAVQFCNKLSEMETRKPFYEIDGKEVRVPDWNNTGYRLPTEAEWEYACRANASTPTSFSFGDDPEELGESGWFDSNSEDRTHPVGQKRRNKFGLHDMHGNVWEWCWDWYRADYYKQSPSEDPTGPTWPSNRINRGGGLVDEPRHCRSAKRRNSEPGSRVENLGFRLALGQSGR